MYRTQWQLEAAASQVRGTSASLSAIVSQLVAAGVWSGADADRFERDWHDLVTTRLYAAAHQMDAVTYQTRATP